MRYISSFVVCCLITPLINISPVFASEIKQNVKQISQEIATGNSNQQIPQIKLSPGYGVNISFIKRGEIIEKVWLDNPAIASLDVDGCLSGLGKECNSNDGATVVHLRKIKALKFKQLPSSNSSLLTVITKGNSQRRIYLFRVSVGYEASTFHTIEII